MTTRTRLLIAVLVAVALLGGVAMVSADDTESESNAIDWMHDRMADFTHGDQHDHSEHHEDHDHGEHHEDHDHGEHHEDHDHGEHHDNHEPGEHHAGGGGC